MRTPCVGLLLLLAATTGCIGYLPIHNGFSRQWLTTDSEAQSRTDALIQKSQDASAAHAARQPAASATAGSSDEPRLEESQADK